MFVMAYSYGIWMWLTSAREIAQMLVVNWKIDTGYGPLRVLELLQGVRHAFHAAFEEIKGSFFQMKLVNRSRRASWVSS